VFRNKRGRKPGIRRNSNDEQDSMMMNPEKRQKFNEDDEEKLPMSREERKMQRYLESIARMERSTSGKKEKGKNSPTDGNPAFHSLPNPAESSGDNKNRNTVGQAPVKTRRKNSRAMSVSNEDLVDLDSLKKHPELLKYTYPLAPMYLGRSVWLAHTVEKYQNLKSSAVSKSQAFIFPSSTATTSKSPSSVDASNFSYRKKLLKSL
jgi:hypothetical protein